MHAVNNRNEKMVRCLLLHSADPFVKTADGESAFDISTSEIIENLLRVGHFWYSVSDVRSLKKDCPFIRP
jgi:hypothetical protein